jgi:hypothetical protein
MALNAAQRATVARLGAYTRWASEPDRVAATSPARRGFMARFEREVDPDGTLPAAERGRRAKIAMKAHMTRMALLSSLARERRKST